MGLATGFSGGKLLVDLVGRRRALDILLNARKLSADEAAQIGLCDAAVDGLDATMEFLGNMLYHHDSRVCQAVKAICANACEYSNVAAALRGERTYFSPLVGGQVHLEKLDKNIKH
jgi:enoyl-CoA hydratase/carnithine racemase